MDTKLFFNIIVLILKQNSTEHIKYSKIYFVCDVATFNQFLHLIFLF